MLQHCPPTTRHSREGGKPAFFEQSKMPLETTLFDAADYLDSVEAIAVYLEDAFETDDPTYIARALGTVARAKGMTEVARKTGLSRESLYKALSAEGNPEFATILKVMSALDLKISAREG
jgi:probable addiction module antidote protein